MSRRSLASPVRKAGVLQKAIVLLRYDFLMEALYAERSGTSEFIEGLNQVICE